MNFKRETILLGDKKYKILRGGNPLLGSVLFLHGWNSKSERYEHPFSFLPENFSQIIIPDLPGFGESQKPENVWGVDEYAEWAMEIIKAIGVEKIIIAGHSFGGQIAIRVASENNPKVIGALLYASARVQKHSSVKKAVFYGVAKLGNIVFSIPVLSRFSLFVKKILYRAVGSSDYLNAKEMREIMVKVTGQDMKKNILKISVPVSIIWGAKDASTPVSDAFYLKKNISNSNLKIIGGAGHKFHITDPEKFAREFSEQITWILR
jgi:pimeloyl-ACP methyl ester carboxylesterase